MAREPETRRVDTSKKRAALRKPSSPEVVRDAISMVDLAISRCRAGRYADEHSREQVLAALHAARQELCQISGAPETPVDMASVPPTGKRLVRNGHDPSND